MTATVRLLLLLPLCVAFLAGCGPSGPAKAKVNGSVTYNGAPVTGGTIMFFTSEGGVPGTLAPDGTYSAVGLGTGEAKVVIETESINPNKKTPTYGGGGPGRQGGGMSPVPPQASGASPGTYVKIPAKYAKQETTDLVITLEDGDNTKDLELKD